MYLGVKFQTSGMTERVSKTLMSFMSLLLGLWRTQEVPGLGFIICIPWVSPRKLKFHENRG